MALSSFTKIFNASPAIYHFRVDFPLKSSRLQFGLKKLSEITTKKPAAIALSLNGITNNSQHGHTIYQAFYHSADKLRIPVYTFLQDQATSTTYFTANCGTIIANPFCMIGEVGTTYKSYKNIKKLLNYIGVKIQWLGTKEQHIWNQLSQPSPKQKQFTDKWIQSIQNSMIKTVSLRRNIPIQTIKNIKNKLFSPKQAYQLKLIDQIGTFEDFKSVNYPNNPVKDIILSNKGYSKNMFDRQQISVLMKIKNIIEEPSIGVFSVQDPVMQVIQQLFAIFQARIKNPQSLIQLDNFIGQILMEVQQQVLSQSPLRFQ